MLIFSAGRPFSLQLRITSCGLFWISKKDHPWRLLPCLHGSFGKVMLRQYLEERKVSPELALRIRKFM